MATFMCTYCHTSCCQCQGCHPRIASNGTQVCSKCINTYEEFIRRTANHIPLQHYIAPQRR